MTWAHWVYADAADPLTGVVARWHGGERAYHGTCARIDGPAWVVDRDNAGEAAAGSLGELELEAAASGLVLPRIVLVTRSPVRLV